MIESEGSKRKKKIAPKKFKKEKVGKGNINQLEGNTTKRNKKKMAPKRFKKRMEGKGNISLKEGNTEKRKRPDQDVIEEVK